MASRKAAIEALTGAHAGRVLSCEIIANGVPKSFRVGYQCEKGIVYYRKTGQRVRVAFHGAPPKLTRSRLQANVPIFSYQLCRQPPGKFGAPATLDNHR
jgi:hypothetical protein